MPPSKLVEPEPIVEIEPVKEIPIEQVTVVEQPIVLKAREENEMPFKKPLQSVEELKTKLESATKG